MGDSEVPVKCEKRIKRDDKQDMSTAWNLIFLWINEHLLLQLHLCVCSVVIWMVKVYTSVVKSPTNYSTEINLKQNTAVCVGAAPCNG